MSSKLSILRPYYSMLIKEFLCFMLCFSGGCHNRRSIILKGTVEKRRKWGFSLENQIIRDQLKFVLYAALKQNAINAMNLCTPSSLKLTQIKWSIANLLNQLLCWPVLGIFPGWKKMHVPLGLSQLNFTLSLLWFKDKTTRCVISGKISCFSAEV